MKDTTCNRIKFSDDGSLYKSAKIEDFGPLRVKWPCAKTQVQNISSITGNRTGVAHLHSRWSVSSPSVFKSKSTLIRTRSNFWSYGVARVFLRG